MRVVTPPAGVSETARERYRYRSAAENQLAPIATAAAWPFFAEQYGPRWLFGILPGALRANGRRFAKRIQFAVQRATFRLEKRAAFRSLFPAGETPPFADDARGGSDAAFAFYRIAALNPVVLQQERSLASLRERIALDVPRIETRFAARGRALDLAAEAAHGRLFAVDYRLIQRALGNGRLRDSRWRNKYLASPIAVFLEAPGFHDGCELVPLAIQVDHPKAPGHNPVYTPDDGDAWRIAKAFFEAADSDFQSLATHPGRTHMALSAFCLAAARQLAPNHPVSVLLRPHTRYTLASAKPAYDYFVNRKHAYYETHSGTLEVDRNLARLDHEQRPFRDFAPLRDFARRGVLTAPADYPYRDDALLWVAALERFVREYLDAHYACDEDVQGDAQLQAFAVELMDPRFGNLRGLFEDDRLATRAQLADLLAQLLFTAGPFHAAVHFGSSYYYRYAPVFPSSACRPPLARGEAADLASFLRLLPPVSEAAEQFADNSLDVFRYDRFGDYRRYALGSAPGAQRAIENLHGALAEIERSIAERDAKRMLRSDFMKPSLVPNSANI